MKTNINTIRVLRSPDSVDSSAEIDPLAMPSSEIDLSRPIAPASNYKMVIKEVKKEPNKKNTGENLVVKMASVDDIRSVKGDVIPAGRFVLTHYLGLTVTDKRSNKDIAQDLTRYIRGCRLPANTTPRDVINNPSVLAGNTILAKVGIQQETAEFAESNTFKSVVLEG